MNRDVPNAKFCFDFTIKYQTFVIFRHTYLGKLNNYSQKFAYVENISPISPPSGSQAQCPAMWFWAHVVPARHGNPDTV